MFRFTKKDKRTNLEKEIDSVLLEMSSMRPSSEEYADMAKNVETLYKAKGNDPRSKVSADTIAIIVGNLLGICLILGYEKANVITSKALGFVIRGRV